MRSISIRARTSCDACGAFLPLNAMVPHISCPRCSEVNELEDGVWLSMVRGPSVRNFTGYINGRSVIVQLADAEATCAGCGAAIVQDEALRAGDAGSVTCACGAATSVRRPPEAFKPDGFRLMVGEDVLQIPAPPGAAVPAPKASQPVAFTCPLCAGVLRVDGTSRVVECQYCTGSVYLPDDLWHVFHPVHRVRTWYLLVTGD